MGTRRAYTPHGSPPEEKEEAAPPDDAAPALGVDTHDLQYPKGQTEAANAARLVEFFGGVLRYVVEWQDWIFWADAFWSRDRSAVVAQELAAKIANSLWARIARYRDLEPEAKKRMISFVRSSNSARSIAAAVTLARGKLLTNVHQLDRDPWLLNCANGTLHLRSGELRPARQSDYFTKLCPTAYRPGAAYPRWHQFLHEVFDNSKPLIGFLRRLLGYGITGDVREQVMPILWGDGENGKTTLLMTLLHVIGDDYSGSPPRELFAMPKNGSERHPTQLMTLQGKRLMMASESDSGCQLNEALIKYLTGGDRITARGMYENFGSFDPTHKLLLSTNYKPEVHGGDHAIWRRLKLIPFVVKFEGAGKDPDLLDKLKAEAEGILAWLVEGYKEWQQHGLQEPACVQLATQEYKAEMDRVGIFLELYCERGEYAEGATDLYEKFKKVGDSDMTQTAFGRELTKRGFPAGKSGGFGIRRGLRLIPH
jgi:putative DNA primase/helicase